VEPATSITVQQMPRSFGAAIATKLSTLQSTLGTVLCLRLRFRRLRRYRPNNGSFPITAEPESNGYDAATVSYDAATHSPTRSSGSGIFSASFDAPPPARSVSPPPPTTPPRADESGAETVAVVRAPTAAAQLAAAAKMDPAADIDTGKQHAATRSQENAPAFTPRPEYGPPSRTISRAQLRRGLRIICTECKRSQTVNSNVSMCPDTCLCPWARRPSPQPGWGWRRARAGDGAYFSCTVERRAMRRLCFVCRNTLIVGSEHPTCPPWCSCPWASPPTVLIPPNENSISERITWEGRQERLDQERAEVLERMRQLTPRWERRLFWPNDSGNRNEYPVSVNLPQDPVWWEPQRLGPLPLPRRH